MEAELQKQFRFMPFQTFWCFVFEKAGCLAPLIFKGGRSAVHVKNEPHLGKNRKTRLSDRRDFSDNEGVSKSECCAQKQ
jgi:hypothetical protein